MPREKIFFSSWLLKLDKNNQIKIFFKIYLAKNEQKKDFISEAFLKMYFLLYFNLFTAKYPSSKFEEEEVDKPLINMVALVPVKLGNC